MEAGLGFAWPDEELPDVPEDTEAALQSEISAPVKQPSSERKSILLKDDETPPTEVEAEALPPVFRPA